MRARYVWDYAISEQEFDALLAGRAAVGRLNRAWAAARLIDSAPYEEVVRRIGFGELVAADVARALLEATADDWRLVRWIPPPPPAEDFLRDLRALGEDLLLIR